MPVIDVRKDTATLTLAITTTIDAPIERAWSLWDDPRQLERWWGPPTYPATVLEHDLSPGGIVTYVMTGPDGDQPRGSWRVLVVEPPRSLVFENHLDEHPGAAGENFAAMTARIDLSENGGTTTMTVEMTYPSLAAMEQFLAMGMEEGLSAAMSQIDGIVTDVT